MKNVLITGATSGFGYLMVESFLKRGDLVVATGRKLTERGEIFKKLRADYPSRLIELNMDVTEFSEITQVVGAVQARGIEINVLVNNAGYGLFGPLEDLSDEQIRRQFEVNFFGLIRVTQEFLPMLRKTKGKVFNLSSAFGFTGFPLASVYCASKFAVEGLTESLDYELRPHGVQVCLIEPGAYRTQFAPNMEFGKRIPEDRSAYKLQILNLKRFQEQMKTKPSTQDPSEVAEGICHLAHQDDLPLRVQFGKDSKGTRVLRSVVPGSVYRWMTHTAFSKLFLKSSGDVQ